MVSAAISSDRPHWHCPIEATGRRKHDQNSRHERRCWARWRCSHWLRSVSRRGPLIRLKLESIDVQTLSGQQVQLKLHMSGPAPEPLPFTIDKPARIAFDLPNTTLALASRRIDVRSGGVDTVLAAEANGRTRLVVNVDALMPYTTKVDGNDIIVTLGSSRAPTSASCRRRARGRSGRRLRSSARSAPSISGAAPTAPAA